MPHQLLTFINQEFIAYRSIPICDTQNKQKKKIFIDGLMTAARIVGVSYDELDKIVKANPPQADFETEDDLTIPTYIRNKKNK